ncbi:odorant receptor 131-2-like [Pangasianodon hypophthalmus]|uniref:odorant receptor 131-2-like n=1 Tax=Pangasianodon hypophthalmus TaxID=310915 RepID=UPI000EFFC788|nr:odorant receptor 131-2-like [Pangasianodon hypophthalmus]
MATINITDAKLSFTYEQVYKVDFDAATVTKIVVAVLMSLFFVYINCIMLFALRSKSVFHETPRYILFAHMLLNDSALLLVTTVMYAMSLALANVARAICSLLVLISICTFQNAPLTLALMSLERYVAICFPLRHSTIATQKSTGIALGIVWFISSLNIVTDIMYDLATDPSQLLKITFCTREKLFVAKWQADKAQGFDILFFVSVTVIILFTYVSIMITARSISSNKESATKAHKTVLLHLIQLGLCLTSFLFATIERALYMMSGSNSSLFIHLRYLNVLIILILPRCLSPLIYGLRDDVVRPLFKYYFCYRTHKIKPVVNVV